MNYELIRKVVEEEVVKALSSAKSTVRLRRPVISESMVVSAWRRGAATLSITPGAIITPAARERATALSVTIEQTKIPVGMPQVTAMVELVMAAVTSQLSGRPSRSAPVAHSKKLITAQDIELCRFNTKILTIGKKTRVTPLAREIAERYGIRIVEA